MIKLAIISFAIITSLASGCNKEKDTLPETESCIDRLKKILQSQPPRIPAAAIWEYQYNGNTVYLVPAPCCDQFNPLYDAECAILCHPDGGITGKGDGKCNDFHKTASDKKLVWTDKRSVE